MTDPIKQAIEALDKINAIRSESHGVTGWHLNGDVATWDELDFDGEFEIVYDFIRSIQPAGEAVLHTWHESGNHIGENRHRFEAECVNECALEAWVTSDEAITAWNTRADQPWYSMDSAPRDEVIIVDGGTVIWRVDGWFSHSAQAYLQWQPKRWQPLPDTDAPTVHTYNPETHMLVERAKVPEGLSEAVKEYESEDILSDRHRGIIFKFYQTAALVAEGE